MSSMGETGGDSAHHFQAYFLLADRVADGGAVVEGQGRGACHNVIQQRGGCRLKLRGKTGGKKDEREKRVKEEQHKRDSRGPI